MDDLSKLPHIYREAGRRPAYRRRFSAEAIAVLGKTHFQRSIGASGDPKSFRAAYDRLEAEYLAVQAAALGGHDRNGNGAAATKQQSLKITARRPPERLYPDDPTFPTLSLDAAALLAQSFFAERIKALDAQRTNLGSMGDEEQSVFVRELEHQAAILEDPDDPDGYAMAQGAAAELLRAHRFFASEGSPAGRRLHELVARAMIQLARIEQNRAKGDYTDIVSDNTFAVRGLEVISAPVQSAIATAGSGVSIQAAADRYMREVLGGSRKDRTNERYLNEMKHIVSFWGGERLVGTLARRDCTELREVFAALPPNFSKMMGGGATLTQLAERRPADTSGLSWETLEKYLSAMRRFIAWANREDLVGKDFASDVKPQGQKPDGSMAKLPFEIGELRRLFERPIYSGCLNDAYGFSRPGPNIIRRSRYWAPLISLYGGLRAGEVLQLTPAHFRTSQQGTEFIVLTRDMMLKNENAEREIPVHPMLKSIGLLEWVARRLERAQTGLLFPEVPADKYNATSSNFSKRFGRDLRHLQLGERRGKVTFHSFRHTFKRALDQAVVAP